METQLVKLLEDMHHELRFRMFSPGWAPWHLSCPLSGLAAAFIRGYRKLVLKQSWRLGICYKLNVSVSPKPLCGSPLLQCGVTGGGDLGKLLGDECGVLLIRLAALYDTGKWSSALQHADHSKKQTAHDGESGIQVWTFSPQNCEELTSAASGAKSVVFHSSSPSAGQQGTTEDCPKGCTLPCTATPAQRLHKPFTAGAGGSPPSVSSQGKTRGWNFSLCLGIISGQCRPVRL